MEFNQSELLDRKIDFWCAADLCMDDYTHLCATSIDEAVQDWKDHASKEELEEVKGEDDTIEVIGFSAIEDYIPTAEEILDDVIRELEENGKMSDNNEYRLDEELVEASENFRKKLLERTEPMYEEVYSVSAFVNKHNKEPK